MNINRFLELAIKRGNKDITNSELIELMELEQSCDRKLLGQLNEFLTGKFEPKSIYTDDEIQIHRVSVKKRVGNAEFNDENLK